MTAKTYKVIFEDKNHNEITVKTIEAYNIKFARDYAFNLFAELNDNDVTHYHVKRVY